MRLEGIIDVFGNSVSLKTAHTLIVGRNGTGKTDLAMQLALDDYLSGRQVVFISSTGGMEWFIKLAQEGLPEHLQGRLVHWQGDRRSLLDFSLSDCAGNVVVLSLRHDFSAEEIDKGDPQLPILEHILGVVLKTERETSLIIDPFDFAYPEEVNDRLAMPLFHQIFSHPGLIVTFTSNDLARLKQPTLDMLRENMRVVFALRLGSLPSAEAVATFLQAEVLDLYGLAPYTGYLQQDVGGMALSVAFPRLADYAIIRSQPVPAELVMPPLSDAKKQNEPITLVKQPSFLDWHWLTQLFRAKRA